MCPTSLGWVPGPPTGGCLSCRGVGGSIPGEASANAIPRLVNGLGSLPTRIDLDPDRTDSTGDAGRDVQHPVADGGDLAAGQIGVVGEADQLRSGDQVGGGQDGLAPGGVRVEAVARQIPQPGHLGLPDPVLDPCVLPVLASCRCPPRPREKSGSRSLSAHT